MGGLCPCELNLELLCWLNEAASCRFYACYDVRLVRHTNVCTFLCVCVCVCSCVCICVCVCVCVCVCL